MQHTPISDIVVESLSGTTKNIYETVKLSLTVPAIEVLDVTGVACTNVGLRAVTVDAAALTHRNANLPNSREASVARTRIICCKTVASQTITYL